MPKSKAKEPDRILRGNGFKAQSAFVSLLEITKVPFASKPYILAGDDAALDHRPRVVLDGLS